MVLQNRPILFLRKPLTACRLFVSIWVGSWQNRPCSKPWAIAQAFCSKSANFRSPYELTLNRHKQSRKQSQIILERFCGRFREFGAICRSWQNRPCSKPWAIAQAFCSKSANFRPLRINPKSTQTVVQSVTNHFRTVLQTFQRVWSDLQELTKSAMFKTMGYSPWPFARNRPIFEPYELTLNRHKQSCKQSQIILERFCGVSESLGAICRSWQNRPCSKPWAIAQAFCSKSADFRTLRINPKSTQTVRKQFKIILERFCGRFREFGAIS